MSLSRYQGATGNQHLGPLTSIIGVDPLPRNGMSRMLYTFDHRMVDGKPATDIVEAWKEALIRPVTKEVKKMLIRDGIDPLVVLGKKIAA